MFENFNFTNFWKESKCAKEEYTEKAPTDKLILEIEQELGYKLPASYILHLKNLSVTLLIATDFMRKMTINPRIIIPI